MTIYGFSVLALSPVRVNSQIVINGSCDKLIQVITVSDINESKQVGDTTYRISDIRTTEDVAVIYDLNGNECHSPPACIGIRPFDLYHGFFFQSYSMFYFDERLRANQKYELELYIKSVKMNKKIGPLNPRLGILINNYPDRIKSIRYDESKKFNSLDGIYFGVSTDSISTKFSNFKFSFTAKGGENAIIIGSFIKSDYQNPRGPWDIDFLNRQIHLFKKRGKEKYLDPVKEYFGFIDESSNFLIVKLVESLGNNNYANPAYLIDDVSIEKDK